MQIKDIKMKFRDQTILRLAAYEDMLLGGHLTFPLLGKQVQLKRQVHVPRDHQSVTPDRLAELAAEQGIPCVVSDWAEEARTFTPPEPEEVA